MNEPGFWDASALVPLCLREARTAACRKALRESLPVVWWGTAVEISSAIARSRQSGSILDREAREARAILSRLRSAWMEILPDDAVRDAACELLERYSLRAADSLQLAAALVWCRSRPAGRRFLCADRRLGEAAQSAGFTVHSF